MMNYKPWFVVWVACGIIVLLTSIGYTQESSIKPNQIIVSDNYGFLWGFDLDTETLYEFINFNWYGNHDIQFVNENKIVFVNPHPKGLYEFDLAEKTYKLLFDDPLIGYPVHLAVGKDNLFYISDRRDHKIYEIDLNLQQVKIIYETNNPSFWGYPDSIAIFKDHIYFFDEGSKLYRINLSDYSLELVWDLYPHFFWGFVFDSNGDLIATSPPEHAIYKINIELRQLSLIHQGPPLGTPEDITLGIGEKDVYVVDSGALINNIQTPPLICKIRMDGSGANILYSGSPLNDGIRDILLTPFIKDLSPEERTDLLITEIEELISNGDLSENEGSPLIIMLELVIESLNAGNFISACNQIGAFNNKVESLILSRKISYDIGQMLIEQANNIRNMICN